MDVRCETDLRAVRDGLIGGGFAMALVGMPSLSWLSPVVPFCAFELAIASCTPLVPFVALFGLGGAD